jgi:hypothetical protein
MVPSFLIVFSIISQYQKGYNLDFQIAFFSDLKTKDSLFQTAAWAL